MKSNNLLRDLSRHLLFEVPSVLSAVLLAIGLSSWKQNHDLQQSMEYALRLVIEDMGRIEGISFTNTGNQEMNKRLDSAIQQKNWENIRKYNLEFGIPEVRINSWDLFKNNPDYINRVDLRLLDDIQFLMSEFELYKRAVEKLRAFLVDHDPEMEALKEAKYFLMYRREVVRRGDELTRKYQDFKTKYPVYF